MASAPRCRRSHDLPFAFFRLPFFSVTVVRAVLVVGENAPDVLVIPTVVVSGSDVLPAAAYSFSSARAAFVSFTFTVARLPAATVPE